MNVRDRFLATLRGEAHDRVPLLSYGLNLPDRESLARITDPREREIAERAFDYCHGSWHVPTYGNRYFMIPPEAMHRVDHRETPDGTETTVQIDTPKGPLTDVTRTNPLTKTLWTVKYPCETLADIDKIRSVPWHLPEKLAPPDPAGRPGNFHQRLIAHASVSSPFVCVGGMMPFQYFLELCATEYDLIKELTAECCNRILAGLDVILEGGLVEYVWMGGCEWVTPPMASPKIYEDLVQVREARIIERCHAAGAMVHVHCHGNVRSTLESAVQRGTDLFEPVEPPPDGDITLAEAKELVAGRMTLAGNIEARVLTFGSDDEIDAATRAAFEGGKNHFVLGTTAGFEGAVSPRMLRNYHRMLDLYEELSPI